MYSPKCFGCNVSLFCSNVNLDTGLLGDTNEILKCFMALQKMIKL